MGGRHVIRLFVTDVDGVLTDGSLDYGVSGPDRRIFDARDAHGVRMLVRMGVTVAFVTARRSHALSAFADDVGVEHVIAGNEPARMLADLQRELGIDAESTAVMGDDVTDLPMFGMASIAFAPADAEREVLDAAVVVTGRTGGRGAFRDAARHVLSMNAEAAE